MSAATPQERQALEASVTEVERQYTAGLFKQGLATLFTPQALLLGSVLSQLPAFVSDEQRQVAKDMESVRQDLGKYRNRYLPWAIAGKRDDGTPYDRALFHLMGRDLALGIEQATGEAWDQNVFKAVANVAHDTATTLQDYKRAVDDFAKNLPEPKDWERLGRLALLAGGVALVVVVVATVGPPLLTGYRAVKALT